MPSAACADGVDAAAAASRTSGMASRRIRMFVGANTRAGPELCRAGSGAARLAVDRGAEAQERNGGSGDDVAVAADEDALPRRQPAGREPDDPGRLRARAQRVGGLRLVERDLQVTAAAQRRGVRADEPLARGVRALDELEHRAGIAPRLGSE